MTNAIVFVLGAGFSAPFGVPTMKPFLQSFRDTAVRKYPELEATLIKHFERLTDESDIEALLSSLGSAEGIRGSLPPGEDISAEHAIWENESKVLKAHLVSYIIERCERFDREEAIKTLEPLLKNLTKEGRASDICFATTNYDRIVEYVSDSIGLRLSDGFGGSLEAVTAPWTGQFEGKLQLYKLHGSVTYYGDREASGSKKFFRLDRGYPLPSPDFRLTRDGNALEPLMVLPTLEKETLDDPYGQLNHRFAEMMSKSRIVVAIGTSLRDKDLISAFNYNAQNCVVLLVDIDPSRAREQIQGSRCITLRANTKDFLCVSTDRLVALLDNCAEEDDDAVVVRRVEEFAKEEIETISQWVSMSESQRGALDLIQTDCGEEKKLQALQTLRGIADAGVIDAVSKMCKEEHSALVRKAAAGCLGMSGIQLAVESLRKYTIKDPLADVRLEGYLALKELGGELAMSALDEARGRWPDDSFFD